MKAPEIRRSTVLTNSLVIVGLDVEPDESTKDYVDEAVHSRVLSNPATYAAASEEAKLEWDGFLQSIRDTGGLLQPPIVDVKETENGYVAYVIDGRRRAAAMKQLLQLAVDAGDELTMKKFERTAVTTVPSSLSRADVAVIANQYRKNYTVEEQVRMAGAMREMGVDKAEVAKRLNCSVNHTDKLFRIYKSIPALRNAIFYKELDKREGEELSWCYDDHDLQTRVFNAYMSWRNANYCMKRHPGNYAMAQRFHKFVLELGIQATEDQLKKDINMWLYGAVDNGDVPTIDGGTTGGATGSDSSGGNGGGNGVGGSVGGSVDGGSVDSLKLEDGTGAVDGGDTTGEDNAATPAAPATSIIVFKLTNKDLKSFLLDNYRGFRYADGLNRQARALLELIVLGKAPEKVDVHTMPILEFLVWEDQFTDAFKRHYGQELWDKIAKQMDAREKDPEEDKKKPKK